MSTQILHSNPWQPIAVIQIIMKQHMTFFLLCLFVCLGFCFFCRHKSCTRNHWIIINLSVIKALGYNARNFNIKYKSACMSYSVKDHKLKHWHCLVVKEGECERGQRVCRHDSETWMHFTLVKLTFFDRCLIIKGNKK